MTKTYARSLARQARRWGYSETGPTTAAVMCPQCRSPVETIRPISGSLMKALDRAVVDHLLYECEVA